MFSSDYYFYIGNEIKTLWSAKGMHYNFKYPSDRYPFIPLVPNVNSSNPLLLYRDVALCGYDLGKHASFVPWVDNKISVFETAPDKIAVSFGFSGCYMAKYSINDKCYISHIQSGLGDQKHVWNDFCNRNRSNNLVIHALFKPTSISDNIYSYRNSQLRRGVMCTIAGVIMPDNRCYAVVVNVATHLPLYITEVTNNYKFFIPNVDWVSEGCEDSYCNIFTRV